MTKTLSYTQVLSSDSSFQLIRTNPKLTGNIKITVNEKDEAWLDSIPANLELAKDDYSRFPIDYTLQFAENINRFFKNGETPNELIFGISEQVDLTKTSTDFKDQYDFSNYFSGVKYLPSPKYNERLSYFAPLYLKREIPNYFIVLKIKDPLNKKIDLSKLDYETGQSRSEFLIDLFKKATIVKTFDLRATTKIGKYIRDYVNSRNFPVSPLTVSFEENEFTTWNGIIIDTGTLGSKGELLYDQYKQSTPLKFFEENITKGYERNGVIFPNILNLNFIFNDDSSSNYEINRYLGFYVNAIELSELDIDLDRMYAERKTWPNSPKLRQRYLESDVTSLIQNNESGVVFPYKNLDFNLFELENVFLDSENLFFNYLSDKSGKFYLPKLNQPYEINTSSKIETSLNFYGKIGAITPPTSVGFGVVSGTYNLTQTSTSGTGSGAIFRVTLDSTSGISALTVVSAGTDYVVGDTVTCDGTQVGGVSGADDIIVTVSELIQSVVAISSSPHNYSTGNLVIISEAGTNFDGRHIITVTSATEFTYLPKIDLIASTTTTGMASHEIRVGKITLSNTQVDAANFFGPTEQIFLQDKGTASGASGHSYSVIKIKNQLAHLDEFKIYYPTGTRTDANGKYDLITGTANYVPIDSPGDFYAFNDFDGVTGFDVFYFNAKGLAKEVAQAISGCINSFTNRTFTAYAYDEYVFIKCNSPGDFDQVHKISFFSPSMEYSSVELDGVAGELLENSILNFKGGSRPAGNRLVIDKQHYQKLEQELENLLVRTDSDWSKILKISGYVDLVTEKNLTSTGTIAKAISEYENKMVVTLVDEESPSVQYGDFLMRRKFRPEFGFFSFFPIKDFDFDFYSSTYLNYPQIDLYQNYYIPEEISLLQENQSYRIVNDAIITINDSELTGTASGSVNLSTLVPNVSVVTLEFEEPTVLTNLSNYATVWIVAANSTNYFIGISPVVTSSTTVLLTVYSATGLSAYSNWTVYAGALGANTSYSSFTPINKCSFSNYQGSAVVVYDTPTYSAVLNDYYSRIEPIADENKELKDFPGFFILKDPTKIIPENSTDEYLLKTKYINGLTATEYDFYKENESIDFALRSKVIPYITKWGIKDGFDSRDNPYRLNTELVFGRNNFSPDHNDFSQNPNNFTHEWFYIESKFNYADSLETSVQNNYYFDAPLALSKLISEEKYFNNYFTYTPAFGTEANGDPNEVAPAQFRYSKLFKNSAGQYETFFKGFKLTFKDVQDEAVLGPDGKPIAKNNSTRFDNYKFSCILKPVKEDFFNPEQPPIRYRVIENTNAKSITVVIELSLSTIDQISDYWFVPQTTYLPRYERLTLNTSDLSPLTGANDRLFYAENETPSPFDGTIYPFDTIYGDYRFAFDPASGVSNLNHNLIYAIKNKKFNTLLDNFSNVKLSSQLNISISGENGVTYVTPTTGTIGRYQLPAISNYPSKFSDEINLAGDLSIIAMKNRLLDQFFMIDYSAGFIPQNENPIQSVADSFLNFRTPAPAISLVQPATISPYTVYSNSLPIFSSLTTYVRENYSFFVIGGGKQYYERLFQKISFAAFKQYVNALDPFIEYESYTDGVKSSSPKFYLEIPEVSTIANRTQIISQEIVDKPSQFAFKKNVAYEYEQAPLSSELELNRYKGEYEPIMRDLLICRSGFNFKLNDISNLSLSNIRLNPDVTQFMTLLNFNHIKVADTKILELESDESYLPVYPALDEVAIGRADYFLLRSNWDWSFHHRYTNKSESVPVAGSLRVEEDESFIGKILSVPDSIELEQFTIRQLTADEKLENIDLSQVQIVYKEEEFVVEGFVNLNNVIAQYFIEDGIADKFNEYLVNSNEYIGNFASIEEYVREYIKLNLLKLYEIDTTQFFYLRDASLFSDTKLKNRNTILFEFLSDAQRFDRGYLELRGVQINKRDRLIIKFSIQKELAAGLKISPKIKIKFI